MCFTENWDDRASVKHEANNDKRHITLFSAGSLATQV